MDITEKTYKKNIRKYAKQGNDTWNELTALAKELNISVFDEHFYKLCGIIDSYIKLASDSAAWATKNKISIREMHEDIHELTYS